MEKVKALIRAGSKTSTAIKEALGMSVTEFADKYKLPRGTTSEMINGGRRPTTAQLDALTTELGGTTQKWAELLWEAGKPVPAGR